MNRRVLLVGAPIVSVATLMLGLRVGAGSAVRAATVYAAPAGKPSNGKTPIALQLLTYLEDRGVRETVSISGLTVSVNGKEQWSGASNPDGVAEALVSEAGMLEVRAAGENEPLAMGSFELPPSWNPNIEHPAVRPSKREGALALDVIVEGERLVVGFDTPVWIHVSDPAAALTVTPEPGLASNADPKVGCGGYAEVQATAYGHVVGMTVDAKAGEKTGTWFGALPVAPGAFFAGMARSIDEGKPSLAVLVAPNPRTVVYVEVDDEKGRDFAAALPVTRTPDDPVPRARFEIPPLAPGLHWLVVSGEPRGAERLAGAAIAKPFMVGPHEECSLGAWLAQHSASGFPRQQVLDGMLTRGASNRLRHRLGLVIAFVSLLAAAILEALLLTAASREARAALLLAELEETAAAPVTAKPPGGGLVIALLIALLGFALLAALLVAKA